MILHSFGMREMTTKLRINASVSSTINKKSLTNIKTYGTIVIEREVKTMITYKMITEAQTLIVENWGEQGERVIEQCAMSNPFNNTFESFLSRCTACGGNWGAMLLTGIRDMWANVWDAIPNDMGVFAFPCLCAVLVLCGVDASQN